MKENNGERAIKGFLRAYMAERKLHKAVAYLDKNIQWIGTGAAEHSCTYQETVAALQEELLTEPWPYDYQFQAFQATQVDEKNQLFFILLTAASRSPELRPSATGQRTDGKLCRFTFLHRISSRMMGNIILEAGKRTAKNPFPAI